MGTDVAEAAETLQSPYSFKVHRSMCTKLMKLVDRITKVFPEIEAARPRCSSGIQALCSLNGAIGRAQQLLQYCCDSSKLYLAITGDTIVSRCERSRNLLVQSLGQIQTMVPVMLAAEISGIIDDLTAATFMLDSSDEETGKALRELLHQGTSSPDSAEYSEIKGLQLAASWLHITSPKAILIEKRSIKKQLVKVDDKDHAKRKILNYLFYLLKKYGNLIMGEQTENHDAQHEGSFALVNCTNHSVYCQPVEMESHVKFDQYEAQTDVLSGATAPVDFRCPMSKRVMYDPVVIASGQTFERMWIQKWFDEGHDTCPKTELKLAHLSLTPNTTLKGLISKWCEKYEINIPDPRQEAFHSLDASTTSIASLVGISMNDLYLPPDISNISLGSLDASYSSDSSRTKLADRSSLMLMQNNDDSHKSYTNVNETDLGLLSGLADLPWESQCQVVEDVRSNVPCNEQVCHSTSFENFVEAVVRFLRTACDQHDLKAQRAGSQLLLLLVSKNRSGIPGLCEDAFGLLTSLLDSEVTEEALAILEVLSGHLHCRSKITASGALVCILKMLDSQSKEFQEQAIKILHNLSSNTDICPQIVYLECIPKLVPFIKDSNFARSCIVLLRNLCDTEEGRAAVAETNGCIASIAELLERGSHEDQEHAVAVLLSLCSQRVQYCKLVMDEGVIPSLVLISINGTDKGKASAFELLRQLRDIEFGNEQKCFGSDLEADRDASCHSKEKKSSSKKSGLFRMNLPLFSKPSSLLSNKKR